jgi:hypothetical protein
VHAGSPGSAPPKTIDWPGSPVEALAGAVMAAVDVDAVVAVDDAVRAVVVDAVDGDVPARHAGVAAVDDERLVARAADRERQRVGGERDDALAARLRRRDREARRAARTAAPTSAASSARRPGRRSASPASTGGARRRDRSGRSAIDG